MAKRGLFAALMFFAGLAVGAGTLLSYQRFHDKRTAEAEKRTAEAFSRRLRCNELANQYARNESDDTTLVHVEMMGYSTISNSCVAYFQLWRNPTPRTTVLEWLVLDLLSGERL